MLIGGFQKQSLIDYPGKICSIVFTIGCNFRCPFCHNSELVLPEKIKKINRIPERDVLDYIEKNKKLLDAVEITGGEPTLQKDLKDFIRKIKEKELLVKLDSNGTNPKLIKELLDEKLIDYYAMDIKAPLEFQSYNRIVGGVLTDKMFESIKETIKIIMKSNIEYEFRTTAIRGFHKKEDFKKICEFIRGAKRYVLQTFNPENTLSDEMHNYKAFTEQEYKEIINDCKGLVKEISYR